MRFIGEIYSSGRIGWHGIPLFCVALVPSWFAATQFVELGRLERLRHEGRSAMATLLDPGGGGVNRLWITYEFVPADAAAAVRGRDQIEIDTRTEWEQAVESKRIEVRYLPAEPSVNRIASSIADRIVNNRVSIVVFGVAAVLLGIVGVTASTMSRQDFETWWFAS
jgi:hypothetical protein